jgi:hypothetical protein
LQAIMGTVGTHLLFELGIGDATTLAKAVEPEVSAEQLTKLGLHRVVVKTRAAGKALPAFVVATRKLPEAVGSPYHAQPEVAGLLSGGDVRAWIANRLRQGSEPPSPTQHRASDSDEVTDYE